MDGCAFRPKSYAVYDGADLSVARDYPGAPQADPASADAHRYDAARGSIDFVGRPYVVAQAGPFRSSIGYRIWVYFGRAHCPRKFGGAAEKPIMEAIANPRSISPRLIGTWPFCVGDVATLGHRASRCAISHSAAWRTPSVDPPVVRHGEILGGYGGSRRPGVGRGDAPNRGGRDTDCHPLSAQRPLRLWGHVGCSRGCANPPNSTPRSVFGNWRERCACLRSYRTKLPGLQRSRRSLHYIALAHSAPRAHAAPRIPVAIWHVGARLHATAERGAALYFIYRSPPGRVLSRQDMATAALF